MFHFIREKSPLFTTTTPAPPITAGLGGVGFKSMVMGEPITAGSGTGGDGRHITTGSKTVGDESINRW